jgi:SAM-dependent methyltransferase
VGEDLGQWLRLREAADVRSRSESMARDIASSLAGHDPARLLDLGTGTGSNIRYLAERLRGRQQWLAVDRSADLLAALPDRVKAWAGPRGYDVVTRNGGCVVRGPDLDCEIRTQLQDLGVLGDRRVFEGRHLVTASALLDLVSEQWLRALVEHCRAEGALALFAITYNGRFSCEPREVEDETVRHLMNRHQKTNKGLGGVAAGPDAAAAAERCFIEAGYGVCRESSDWVLGPAESDVQRLLIEGWADAASEIAPESAPMVADWRSRRLAHLGAGRSSLVVGHDDLAAWPEEGTHRGPG